MNRRNFMKAVGGVLAGVMLVPKAKPQLTVAMLQKVKKDLECGRSEIVNEFLLSSDTHLMFREKMEQFRIEAAFKAANPPLVFNPPNNMAAYIVHESGNVEFIHYKNFYKTV